MDARLLAAMNARAEHRGPDAHGAFAGPGFAMGHRRLSILDLSDAGRQPMSLKDRLVVTYNGEIYNYLELRSELGSHGYSFETETDTEVLLAAYDLWGEDCVSRFNGMWAFAIWDRRADVIFCSRDRFGVKPLHYVELGDYFAIGSEVKQFLDLPGFRAKPDPIALARLILDASASTDEREFVEGVRSLRPGHNLRFDLRSGRFTTRRWYDLSSVQRLSRIGVADAKERFRELFLDSVRLRLRSDVDVGVCLSGGVDSSAIASAAKVVSSRPERVRSVSCVWDDPECDEYPYIRAVVEAHHFDAVLSKPRINEMLNAELLGRLVYHQDQPLLSASQFSEYAVFAAARESNITVMLDGQGADEYLAGYAWFFPAFIRGLITAGRWTQALREVQLRSMRRGTALHAAIRSLWTALVFTPLRSRLGESNTGRALPAWAGAQLRSAYESEQGAVQRYHGASSLSELSLREIVETSIPHQLHSEDRNSMLHSIESRLPFLDYRLLEFGLSLPDELKLRDGATKFVLREALEGILPDAIRNRHDKMGFPAPEQSWVRQNAALVRAELAGAVERFPGYFSPALLQHFDAMLERRQAYDGAFFRIVSLNRWASVFVGASASDARLATGEPTVLV